MEVISLSGIELNYEDFLCRNHIYIPSTSPLIDVQSSDVYMACTGKTIIDLTTGMKFNYVLGDSDESLTVLCKASPRLGRHIFHFIYFWRSEYRRCFVRYVNRPL